MHLLCVAAAMSSYMHRIRMRYIKRLYTYSGVSCSDAKRLERVHMLLWGVRRVCVLFLWWWPATSIGCKVAVCTDATRNVQRVCT